MFFGPIFHEVGYDGPHSEVHKQDHVPAVFAKDHEVGADAAPVERQPLFELAAG